MCADLCFVSGEVVVTFGNEVIELVVPVINVFEVVVGADEQFEVVGVVVVVSWDFDPFASCISDSVCIVFHGGSSPPVVLSCSTVH